GTSEAFFERRNVDWSRHRPRRRNRTSRDPGWRAVHCESLCRRANRAIVPPLSASLYAGAGTATEVVRALEEGADIVEVLPGEIFGPAFVKAILGPVPHAPLMPTGGVTIDNAADWIHAGCVALGVGSNLTAGAKMGDYVSITETARQFLAKIDEA